MAIIKCPECGHAVSDKAQSCPNCGYVINNNPNYKDEENNSEEMSGTAVVIMVLGIFICVTVCMIFAFKYSR